MKRHLVFNLIIFQMFTSSASVPLKWTVETSRLQPVVFDVVRGETLELEASFNSYGTPVATSNQTAVVCWQTNGMANAWWTTNAVTTATVARVLFTPQMDPGAPVVHGFIGLSSTTNSNNPTIQQSNNYRAAFTLRFRHGPGETPNALPLPTPTIDCQKVTFLHPESAPFSGGGGGGGMTTNQVSCIITNHVTSGYLCTVAAAKAKADAARDQAKAASRPNDWMPSANDVGAFPASNNAPSGYDYYTSYSLMLRGISTEFIRCGSYGYGSYFISVDSNYGNYLGKTNESRWHYYNNETEPPSDDNEIAVIGDISGAVAVVTNRIATVERTVNDWETYWRGDRVRLSVTNYYGNTSGELPRLRIEEFDHSTTTVVDNVQIISNFFHTVWDENDRHTNYMATTDAKVNAISNNVLDAAWRQTNLQLVNKAPRAWQTVTSAGEDAPPNMVWHTAPQSVFAGGTEYAHVAVGEGSICVLVDKGAPVYTDGAEGQFRFQDQSGQNYFGFDVRSAYKIGCRTDGIAVNSQTHIVSLTYDLTSATNPSILQSTNLVDWADAEVEWEQNPPEGTKVCYINCGTNPRGFYQAEIRYAGGSKFLTNMQADLMGGIAASNQTLNVIQSVEPYVVSNQVLWRVKQ